MIGLQTSRITSSKTSNVYGVDFFPNLTSSNSSPIYVDSVQYSYYVGPLSDGAYTYSWGSVSDVLDLIVNGISLRSYKVKGLFNPVTVTVDFHRKIDQLIPINTAFFFRSRFGLVNMGPQGAPFIMDLSRCYVFYGV